MARMDLNPPPPRGLRPTLSNSLSSMSTLGKARVFENYNRPTVARDYQVAFYRPSGRPNAHQDEMSHER